SGWQTRAIIVKIDNMNIKDFLKECVEKQASDLHYSPELPPILRINGNLVPMDHDKLTSEETSKQLLGIMSQEQQKAFKEHLQLDFSLFIPELAGFRVNAFFTINGMCAVFRVIPNSIPTLESLGSPQIFKHLLDLSSGLILVAGPTGSGKSTTLAAMVNYIN